MKILSDILVVITVLLCIKVIYGRVYTCVRGSLVVFLIYFFVKHKLYKEEFMLECKDPMRVCYMFARLCTYMY